MNRFMGISIAIVSLNAFLVTGDLIAMVVIYVGIVIAGVY